MCRLRQVRNVYSCGHAITEPDQLIPCESRFCRLSAHHPPHCANCRDTCWQYRQYPEQYSPKVNAPCPDCGGASGSGTSYR